MILIVAKPELRLLEVSLRGTSVMLRDCYWGIWALRPDPKLHVSQ